MTMLAILSWGGTEEDPKDFVDLHGNEEVVQVRRKGGTHFALYQRGANFLVGDQDYTEAARKKICRRRQLRDLGMDGKFAILARHVECSGHIGMRWQRPLGFIPRC